MPELPEAETLCRQLRQTVIGAQVVQTEMHDWKLGEIRGLEGRRIVSINRWGKRVEMVLDDGVTMSLHLRMTGRLLWQNGTGLPPHSRFVMSLPQGKIILIDSRRFATLSVQVGAGCVPSGIDPLVEDAPLGLTAMSRGRLSPVKSFLMDQRCVAGIGNIYACEVLHATQISPWRRTCDLSFSDWEMMAGAMRSVLSKAIVCRGTTISDWRDLFGEEGEYQKYLMVYGREGEPCLRCGGRITRRKLSGVGTYFCPSCQV